jgi:hypothetical protein
MRLLFFIFFLIAAISEIHVYAQEFFAGHIQKPSVSILQHLGVSFLTVILKYRKIE